MAKAIASGYVQPGEAFENELSLAARLELSRPTVRRSIAELVERGLLIRRRGVGTTVAKLTGSPPDAAEFGGSLAVGGAPSLRVLRIVRGERNRRAADVLRVLPYTPLVYLERQWLVDGRLVGWLRDWLPPAFDDLTEAEAEVCDIDELLRRRGVTPTAARRTVACRPAVPADLARLGLDAGGVVLAVTRYLYDHLGRPVAFGEHCYRADRHQVEVTVRAY